jgi:CRISPR system Cascade subunit CasD
MSVLLLRLAGSMQSWGTQSRFPVRDTGLEPSKSGVVGLLCAALGRPRTEPVDDLAGLRMAVRVDRQGWLARDYHTAQEDPGAAARSRIAIESDRYYLADADFLVGLEGDRSLLEALDAALRRPVWPLYLGRKAFVPGLPVAVPDPGDAIRDGGLIEVLANFPWFARPKDGRPREKLRYVYEVPLGAGEPRQDVPLSFAQRTFAIRHVKVDFFEKLPEIRFPEDRSCS